MRIRGSGAAAVVVALLLTAALPASAATGRTSGTFADDDSSVHERSIEVLAASGITYGCGLGRFCPTSPVTRAELAAFVVRARQLPATTRDWFADDDGHVLEDAVNRLREAGHTRGCDVAARRFCPDVPISRGEAAVFLVGAFELPASPVDHFTDDDGSLYEHAIDAIAAAGVVLGCNPPDNTRFCPDDALTRGQMATILTRALRLPALSPPGEDCEPARFDCTASDRWHPVALTWDGIELRLPSSATEVIGLHQSSHEGARDLDPLAGAPTTLVMESRGRLAGPRSAADLVSHPDVEIRSPVTGTVVRGGTYTLYCRYSDDFVVIEPDGRPGIEVKLLHIDGLRVRAGDRVVAGVTLLARGPTPLPFASQVDELSGPADWPHVHLEVVDTAIPNIPSPGGGC